MELKLEKYKNTLNDTMAFNRTAYGIETILPLTIGKDN